MLFPNGTARISRWFFREVFPTELLFPFTNGNHLNLDGMDIKQNDPSIELQKTYCIFGGKKQLQAAFSIQESNATSEEEQAVSEELMGPRMPKV